jgi:hypothetical protein
MMVDTKKLTASIPEKLFDQFKSKTAIEGKTIKEVIEEFVKKYVRNSN